MSKFITDPVEIISDVTKGGSVEAPPSSVVALMISKMPDVLCVDCDGTLIRSDLLQESLWRFVKSRLFGVFQVLWWLLKGRARLKYELAGRVSLPYETLALNRQVVNFIEMARASGRKVLLVTAASQVQAEQLARHLGFFDGVYGSDSTTNLKAEQKAALLTKLFGRGGFAYAGDSRADLPVWAAAGAAIVVTGSQRLLAKARSEYDNVVLILTELRGPQRWIKLTRIHQWAKNLILFVPVVTAHRMFDVPVLRQSLLAFFSFGLIASSTYILNDLIDLDTDRLHPKKKQRPLACGSVGIFEGVLAAMVMFAAGASIALLLPTLFGLTVAFYIILTVLYSACVKRMMLADAVLLGGLYSLRLYAGGTATGISLSTWLLAFSIFIFFSLALAKRLAELRPLLASETAEHARLGGRAYTLGDIPAVTALGTSSGLISVLVLVLYINGPEVVQLYSQPKLLLLLVPLLLYWIGRIWMLAQRGDLLEDPVLYAVKDFKSYVVAALALAIIAAASLSKLAQ